MRNDFSQSKNAPVAGVLLVVGILIAVVMPAANNAVSGWLAGVIGLVFGLVTAWLAMQGGGAGGEAVMALRTAGKAAQRGERPARPMNLSPDVADVFTAIEDLVGDTDTRRERVREIEGSREKLAGELKERAEQAG